MCESVVVARRYYLGHEKKRTTYIHIEIDKKNWIFFHPYTTKKFSQIYSSTSFSVVLNVRSTNIHL